jgi:hypothetical protein
MKVRGYPDGTLSFVPLVWMAEQVEHDLRFQPGQIDHSINRRSAQCTIQGAARRSCADSVRQIGEDRKVDGGPPVVHFAVVERMLHGSDDYAPVMLPASARGLLPGGGVMGLTDEDTRRAMRSAYRRSGKTTNTARTETADAAANAFIVVGLTFRNVHPVT